MRAAFRTWWRESLSVLAVALGGPMIAFGVVHHGINGETPTPHWWADAVGGVGLLFAIIGGLFTVGTLLVCRSNGWRLAEFRANGPLRVVALARKDVVEIARQGGGRAEKILHVFRPEDAEAAIEFVAEQRAALRPNIESERAAAQLARVLNAGDKG